jgi:MarR family transcriptional regulator, organic hydroperoxide resistance regulator
VPPSPAAEEAWALFWRIFSADKPRRMAVFSELGLSFQQAMALGHLSADEPLPMSALAGALQCDNSNVTGIVDRMEDAGLVERRAFEGDRRVKAVALTPLGELVRDQVRARAGTPPPEIAALSDEDAALLRDVLRRALGATPPPAPAAQDRRTSPTA